MSGGFVVWACFACLNNIFELLKQFFVLGFFCCVRSCRSYYHPDRIICYTIYVRKIINTNINTKLNITLNIGIFGITYKKYNDHPRRDITINKDPQDGDEGNYWMKASSYVQKLFPSTEGTRNRFLDVAASLHLIIIRVSILRDIMVVRPRRLYFVLESTELRLFEI